MLMKIRFERVETNLIAACPSTGGFQSSKLYINSVRCDVRPALIAGHWLIPSISASEAKYFPNTDLFVGLSWSLRPENLKSCRAGQFTYTETRYNDEIRYNDNLTAT